MKVRILLSLFAAAMSASAAMAQLSLSPSTTEGPYYPFNSSQRLTTTWLVGADNDLTLVEGRSVRASGTRFLLSGTLVNRSSQPIAGATIELWATDNNGIYYHSGNSTTNRDQNFQNYGTCVTDAEGNWSFRTIRPGLYTGRIRHFHYLVRINGTAVLTSQFMFEEDRASFRSDNVAQPLVSAGTIDLTVLNPTSGIDPIDGATALIATKQIVINATGSSTGTGSAPVITAQPASASVSSGDTVTLGVTATSSSTPSYQWFKDGTTISGATSATLTFDSASTVNTGSYTIRVTNPNGSITSNPATIAVLASSGSSTASLVNLSVRSYLPAATSTLTAGFVIQSNSGKRVLVRAIGPALSEFGVTNALADPRLEIYDATQTKVAENDSWPSGMSAAFAQLGAFALPEGSKDAALTVTLPAGAGTAQVSGNGAGVALVEAYDMASVETSRLVNLSARSSVGAADSVLIAGFSINGTGTKRLLIRAIGPRLNELGVTGALGDPKLEIFNGSGTVLASNDDWSSSLAAAFAQAGAFTLNTGSKDAAVVVTLPAGASYTATVSGVNGATGEALVEIYDLR